MAYPPKQQRLSNTLTDYCCLVGFTNDFLSGAQRPKYQQVFAFQQKFIKGKEPALKTTLGCDPNIVSLPCSGKMNNEIIFIVLTMIL